MGLLWLRFPRLVGGAFRLVSIIRFPRFAGVPEQDRKLIPSNTCDDVVSPAAAADQARRFAEDFIAG